jgi:predicted phosphoribosyltransferase
VLQFKDRREAARRLAQKLRRYRGKNPLVLAIPRGGVPLGGIIADALGGELDVVLVHKLGRPGNPEFAIGSISEDGHIELGPDAQEPFVSEPELQTVIREEARVLRQRRALYTPVKTPADPEGRIAIVVDDGLATGFTMMAALRSLRLRKPLRLVAAVPVSPPETLDLVKRLADETYCLYVPEFFGSVSRFYENFAAVSDDEVVERLRTPTPDRQMPA